jgi:hypothetical protein
MYALIKENKNGLTKVIAQSNDLEKLFNKIDDLKLENVESDDFPFYEDRELLDFQFIDNLLNEKEIYFCGYLKKFIFRVYFIKKY